MCRRAVRLLQHRCDCHAAKNCKPTAEAKWHIICYIIEYRMWFGRAKTENCVFVCLGSHLSLYLQ